MVLYIIFGILLLYREIWRQNDFAFLHHKMLQIALYKVISISYYHLIMIKHYEQSHFLKSLFGLKVPEG